jgi:hypothetical protein
LRWQAGPAELVLPTKLPDGLILAWRAGRERPAIHQAQRLGYMRLLDVPLGLVLTFHKIRLVNGLSRMILTGANRA